MVSLLIRLLKKKTMTLSMIKIKLIYLQMNNDNLKNQFRLDVLKFTV